jgi:hypothetical protein
MCVVAKKGLDWSGGDAPAPFSFTSSGALLSLLGYRGSKSTQAVALSSPSWSLPPTCSTQGGSLLFLLTIVHQCVCNTPGPSSSVAGGSGVAFRLHACSMTSGASACS